MAQSRSSGGGNTLLPRVGLAADHLLNKDELHQRGPSKIHSQNGCEWMIQWLIFIMVVLLSVGILFSNMSWVGMSESSGYNGI